MTALYFLASSLVLLLLFAAALAAFTWSTARRVQAALPPLGRRIEVAGMALQVHEQGSGPALLLIHGLAGQMRHYTYGVVERLSRQYRVVTIDRPGSGYSTRSAATPADLPTQAAAVAGLIDHLQLGPVVIVGHSLGGALALTLALEHPAQVAGLALVAPLTHLPDTGKTPAAFRALTISTPWLRTLFAWTLAAPASIAGSRRVLGQVFGPEAMPHDFALRGGGLMSLCPHQFIAASRDLQALPGWVPAMAPRYGSLTMPVHVLFGRKDRILNWTDNGQALVDKVPGATLKLVDGGHMLPVTKPELTARFIAEVARHAHQQRRQSA